MSKGQLMDRTKVEKSMFIRYIPFDEWCKPP